MLRGGFLEPSAPQRVPDTSVSRHALPKFNAPPVQEVVLCAYFSPLASLKAFHYGDLADLWSTGYPTVLDQEPLRESLLVKGGIELLASDPLPRAWFLSKDEEFLIQVQRDRVVHNWRRRDAGYPSFDELKPRFEKAFLDFQAFVKKRQLGQLRFTRAELGYINVIPIEGPIKDQGLPGLIAPLTGSYSDDFLPRMDTASFRAEYEMRADGRRAGRLVVSANPAEGPTGQVLLLEFTAQGQPRVNRLESVLAFHDVAHEWIVRGFASITTPAMHKIWERAQ